MTLTREQITTIASTINLDYASLMAFIGVESSGNGFTSDGKLLIQFEPFYFAKYLTQFNIAHTYSSTLTNGKKEYIIQVGDLKIENGVEGQSSEWIAFDTAYKINANAAMLSTSIGLPQIMGFNYSSLGYSSVSEMYDDFKKGEYQQVEGLAKLLHNNTSLYSAIKRKDWKTCAKLYNGEGYAINNYDVKLFVAYTKYSA